MKFLRSSQQCNYAYVCLLDQGGLVTNTLKKEISINEVFFLISELGKYVDDNKIVVKNLRTQSDNIITIIEFDTNLVEPLEFLASNFTNNEFKIIVLSFIYSWINKNYGITLFEGELI